MSGYRHLSAVYEHLADDFLHALYKQLIFRYTEPCSVLEIGCGTAPLGRDLAKEGYDVSGFDVSLDMLNMAAYYAGVEQVDLTLFHHDAREPFPGAYALILMPVDVVNHFDSFTEVEAVFSHIEKALVAGGIIIFDYLDTEYMAHLIGHEEAVQVDTHNIHWRVEAVDDVFAHRHVVTVDGVTTSHVSRSYPLKEWATLWASYEILDKITIEHRHLIVLRKR